MTNKGHAAGHCVTGVTKDLNDPTIHYFLRCTIAYLELLLPGFEFRAYFLSQCYDGSNRQVKY